MRLNRAVKLRSVAIAAALALTAAACTWGASDDDARPPATYGAASTAAPPITSSATTAPAPPATPTTVRAAPAAVELASCSESGDFDLLCEAYTILTDEYVDVLDDEVLALAAARGISEFAADEAGDSGTDRFVCQTPSDEFTITCDAAAEVLGRVEVETVTEAAIRGMLEFGLNDPNTVYLPPEAVARIAEDSSGEISGIGAVVSSQRVEADGSTSSCFVLSETCRMTIVGVIADAPADTAGMRVGDVTISVDGESVLGWTADEVIAAVRGTEGTTVVMGMERDGELIELSIVRASILVPVVDVDVLDGGIGYIALTQFTNNSDELFHQALADLLDSDVDKLIVDLRNNPGGALTASVRIASEFLADGWVLRTEAPDGARTYEVQSGGLATSDDLAMVVLVNAASASASEVVSAALQEAGRATIMGEPTFGKNTVQQQFSLANDGALKVTIARWVTPAGASFGGHGVQPDVVVEVPGEAEADVMLEQAIAFFGM